MTWTEAEYRIRSGGRQMEKEMNTIEDTTGFVNAECEKLAKYEDMLAKIIERIPVVEAKVK